MSDGKWMLYGAYGYTGVLIAEEAHRRGMKPILAGRREAPLRALCDRLGMEPRAFGLDSVDAIARELSEVDAVLHAAGPFSATSAPMVDACLRTGTHYLDITGEIEVFEACHGRNEDARAAGCVLMPGVGFDVVPTDCLAASLAAANPGGQQLELAFEGIGSPSAGTTKSIIESLPQGGAIREHGRIRRVPTAWKFARIPFRHALRRAVSVPWGDVSSAYYSTGIPNIVVYMSVPPVMATAMQVLRPALWMTGLPAVQWALKGLADRLAKGPDEAVLETGESQVWGRVTNAEGRTVEGTLVTPEGYRLTALTAVESVHRLVSGEHPPGALTPSTAFGSGFISEFEGCDLRVG